MNTPINIGLKTPKLQSQPVEEIGSVDAPAQQSHSAPRKTATPLLENVAANAHTSPALHSGHASQITTIFLTPMIYYNMGIPPTPGKIGERRTYIPNPDLPMDDFDYDEFPYLDPSSTGENPWADPIVHGEPEQFLPLRNSTPLQNGARREGPSIFDQLGHLGE